MTRLEIAPRITSVASARPATVGRSFETSPPRTNIASGAPPGRSETPRSSFTPAQQIKLESLKANYPAQARKESRSPQTRVSEIVRQAEAKLAVPRPTIHRETAVALTAVCWMALHQLGVSRETERSIPRPMGARPSEAKQSIGHFPREIKQITAKNITEAAPQFASFPTRRQDVKVEARTATKEVPSPGKVTETKVQPISIKEVPVTPQTMIGRRNVIIPQELSIPNAKLDIKAILGVEPQPQIKPAIHTEIGGPVLPIGQRIIVEIPMTQVVRGSQTRAQTGETVPVPQQQPEVEAGKIVRLIQTRRSPIEVQHLHDEEADEERRAILRQIAYELWKETGKINPKELQRRLNEHLNHKMVSQLIESETNNPYEDGSFQEVIKLLGEQTYFNYQDFEAALRKSMNAAPAVRIGTEGNYVSAREVDLVMSGNGRRELI